MDSGDPLPRNLRPKPTNRPIKKKAVPQNRQPYAGYASRTVKLLSDCCLKQKYPFDVQTDSVRQISFTEVGLRQHDFCRLSIAFANTATKRSRTCLEVSHLPLLFQSFLKQHTDYGRSTKWVFLPCVFFLLSSSFILLYFPRLISAVADWMSAMLHMATYLVAPLGVCVRSQRKRIFCLFSTVYQVRRLRSVVSDAFA